MHPYLNIALIAARKAGDKILQTIDRGETLRITEKQTNDFVTHVDHLSERIILNEIQKAYPQHAILAEESGEKPGEEACWIIDPIDGTANFMRGYPQFAISIGIKVKDKLTLGLIYDPIKQEVFMAEKGRGAYLNDKRIRISPRSKFANAIIAVGMPFPKETKRLQAYTRIVRSIFRECGDIRRGGSAALDLAYVACGRVEAYWELNLKPWDIAAGVLIAAEAGAIVTDTAGKQDFLNNGNVLAATPKLYRDVYRLCCESPAL
ncbi:MAG: inositol monophosphatase family protein [Pseudomonadota bacterium]